MTGDVLAEMEHKHISDTICRINGMQPAWLRVRELWEEWGRDGVGWREKEWNLEVGIHRLSIALKKGFLSIATISDCGTNAEIAQQIKDLKYSNSFFLSFFLCFCRDGDSLAWLERFETRKEEITLIEMLITHSIMKNTVVCDFPALRLHFLFSLSSVELQQSSGNPVL